jgi:hypothetical protein
LANLYTSEEQELWRVSVLLCQRQEGGDNMNKLQAKESLGKALDDFRNEIESQLETSSFDWKQQEELRVLMKQVFYTLHEFKKVIEEIAD